MARQGLLAARVVILVAFLDLFIQFPVVAPYARSLGASPTLVGVIVGAFSATNLVGNLIAGVMVDRWGRKRPVQAGLIVTIFALLGYAFASSPSELLVARIVHGFAAAILTPGAFALVGDCASPDKRARAMGITGAIIAVAAVLGPPFGGIAKDELGFGVVFVTAAALMLVAALVYSRFAPNDPVASTAPRSSASLRGYLAVWTRPSLLAAYLGAMAFTVGLGALVTHLPILVEAKTGSSARSGDAFGMYALMALIMMASPTNRLSDRYGRPAVVTAGLVAMAAGLALLSGTTSNTGIGTAMAVFGVGFGLLFPAATALVTEATDMDERGAAFGVFYAVYSLGVVIGSVASGRLAEVYGDLSGAPFLVGAVAALVIAPLVWLAGRKRSAVRPEPATMRQ